MCNFVLPPKEKLPRDQRKHRVLPATGKKFHSKWKKKYENLDREKNKRRNETLVMQGNLKDILSHLSTDIDQETLLLYLQDKLPEDKKYELEKQLMENEFAGDALEGLREIKDKQQIHFMVEMLNRDLKKKTEKKRKRREKMQIKDQTWLYISAIIIILLILISYMVLVYLDKR